MRSTSCSATTRSTASTWRSTEAGSSRERSGRRPMRAAVVGTGRMGAAMARRIAGAGHELTLFNRTASTAQSLADELGATAAATAREAAESAEVVITSLADDRAVAATYRGDNGVLAGLAAGAVACEASTVDPETPRSLEAAARERGGWLIDTPVSGSAK
ncbi:MAG: NAD(P)-binding domain-containing protein, partial [Candidatus Limnocylindrales bacterium]